MSKLKKGGLGSITIGGTLKDINISFVEVGVVTDGSDLDESGVVRAEGLVLSGHLKGHRLLLDGAAARVLGNTDGAIGVDGVTDGHTVLGKSTSLIRGNASDGTKGLDNEGGLHKDLLLGHALGSNGKSNGDGGQETLGDVSNNDTNGKDDSIKDLVTRSGSEDEKDQTDGKSNEGNDVNKALDFGLHECLWLLSKLNGSSNLTHGSVITNTDDNTQTSTLDNVGTVEGDVLG